MAAGSGVDVAGRGSAALHLLKLPEEIQLIKSPTRYPEASRGPRRHSKPHRVTVFLNELAGIFHSYYNRTGHHDDEALTGQGLFSCFVDRSCQRPRCPGRQRSGEDVTRRVMRRSG